MDISCDIIRDLLPLYAEDLVSVDSRKLVDEHLCSCDPCTKHLGILKKAASLPIEVETKSLKRVEHTIRKRKIMTVAAALMTAVCMIVTTGIFLLIPYALTAEEAIEGVELREDGSLAIDFARGVVGRAGRGIFDTDNFGHICSSNRYDWYRAQQLDKKIAGMTREELEEYIAETYDVDECTQREWDRFFNIQLEYGVWIDGDAFYPYVRGETDESKGYLSADPAQRNHWYLDPVSGDGIMLMWDGGKEMPTSIIWTSSSGYLYVFWGSLVLAALFYLISRGITGIWKGMLARAAIILMCTAASVLLVTGGQMTTLEYYLSNHWTEAACLETLVLSLTALLWYQLYRRNRQDRGL